MEMTLSSPFEGIFSPKEINTQKNSLNLNYELSIQIKEEKNFFSWVLRNFTHFFIRSERKLDIYFNSSWESRVLCKFGILTKIFHTNCTQAVDKVLVRHRTSKNTDIEDNKDNKNASNKWKKIRLLGLQYCKLSFASKISCWELRLL